MDTENITRSKKREVPICDRYLLTINEASDYTGIGICRLRMLAAKPQNNFIIYVGAKKMFKRKKLDEFLDRAASI